LVAHTIALFLMSVPGIAQRFGVFRPSNWPDAAKSGPVTEEASLGRTPELADFIGVSSRRWGEDAKSPLLWLAWRVARNRERLGLHYPSDSQASRRLAVGLWALCIDLRSVEQRQYWYRQGEQMTPHGLPLLRLPTLDAVLKRACAEWPERQVRKADGANSNGAKGTSAR
jgi:hypothetical protein